VGGKMIAVRQLGNSPVRKMESVFYNRLNEKFYKEMFESYIKKGVIKNCSFYDESWTVETAKRKINIIFKFNELQFEKAKESGTFVNGFNISDLNLSTRAYILYQLNVETTRAMNAVIVSLRKLLNQNFLTKNEVSGHSLKIKECYYRLYKLYFRFIDDYFNNEELLDDLEQVYNKFINSFTIGKRPLPAMETMFRFNDIIEKFIKATTNGYKDYDEFNFSDDNERKFFRLKYFPVILWWKITSILPLRVHEFCVTPNNCFSKKGGKYFNFRRSQLKGGSKQKDFNHTLDSCYSKEEIPIGTGTRALINEYLDLVKLYDAMEDFYGYGSKGPINREFLLSYRAYKHAMKETYNGSRYLRYIDEDEFFSQKHLNRLLDWFLIEIVNGRLGIDIVSKNKEIGVEQLLGSQMNDICLMDTRHFAIMNMVFMGYEPATLQRIIGHKTVSQSYSYFNHAEIFSNCYILNVATQKAFENNSKQKEAIFKMNFDEIFGQEGDAKRRLRIIKYKKQVEKGEITPKKLKHGECMYLKNDLVPCKLLRAKHGRCRFFLPNDEVSLKMVEDEYNKVDDEITAELKVLDEVLKNNRKYTAAFNEQVHVSVNKLRSLMLIKAETIADYIINGVEKEV
jgi:hypothetical protein